MKNLLIINIKTLIPVHETSPNVLRGEIMAHLPESIMPVCSFTLAFKLELISTLKVKTTA